jgi:hypothetical protein
MMMMMITVPAVTDAYFYHICFITISFHYFNAVNTADNMAVGVPESIFNFLK